MKELTNTSTILHFFMEFLMLLGSDLGLAIKEMSFLDISMLLYGLEIGWTSSFLADFLTLKK